MGTTLGTQHNTELARSFRTITLGGWANLSDGDVEAPTGFFALVHIEPNELAELKAAFDDEYGFVLPMPGSYLYGQDSNGNSSVTEYLTLDRALEAYNQLSREFALWSPTCPECGNEGPHTRVQQPNDNTHVCVCGNRWDPTDGVGEVKQTILGKEV